MSNKSPEFGKPKSERAPKKMWPYMLFTAFVTAVVITVAYAAIGYPF